MNDLNFNGLLNTASAVVIGVTIVISAAWIIVRIITSMKERANTRTRADVYNKLIDKFSAAPEFVEFLQSDAGLRFIEEHTVEVSLPMSKILSSLRLGVNLSLAGAGMLLVANVFSNEFGGFYVGMAVGGTVALTIGVGFLVSAFVSYKLCKHWGLLTGEKVKAE
jgi:ABC-type multidrug transport system fused ATPase/permease subunit